MVGIPAAAHQRCPNRPADFETILVYDVSRWGRFQDADESAYYEYICKRAGIRRPYCAEQFENDGCPVSTIVKGVKRAMAGEYSRELSAKVFAASAAHRVGFPQGGPPGYGLRRMLIDQSGAVKAAAAAVSKRAFRPTASFWCLALLKKSKPFDRSTERLSKMADPRRRSLQF